MGKRIAKIGVRNSENPDLIPVKWRLFVRNLTLLILPIEFFMMLFSTRRERLGDLIAKTVVVKLENVEEVDNKYVEEYIRKREENLPNYNKKMKRNAIIITMSCLLVLTLFISSIGMVLKNSKPYKLAIENIETNVKLASYVGEIKGYGFIPMGSIETVNDNGKASFKIKVKGENGDFKVRVILIKPSGKEWGIQHLRILK